MIKNDFSGYKSSLSLRADPKRFGRFVGKLSRGETCHKIEVVHLNGPRWSAPGSNVASAWTVFANGEEIGTIAGSAAIRLAVSELIEAHRAQ